MEKTFKYYRTTHCYSNEYESYDEGYDFEYTVDESELLEAVVDLIYEDYFYDKDNELCWNVDYVTTVKKGIRSQINEEDSLADYVDHYEDDLKDYFEDEAMESERND